MSFSECRLRFLIAMILGTLMPSITVTAREIPSAEVTVKVTSALCRNSPRVFEGSGFLVTVGDRTLVVTSEHVIFHTNKGYCHRVLIPGVGEVKANLVAADWGKGLAVLEPILSRKWSLEKRNLPNVEKLDSSAVAPEDRVTVGGFPFGTETLVSHSMGRILVSASTRHLFPNLTQVIELIEAHGEFGMSGGPVISTDGSRILGLISHQYLELHPGSRTRIGEFDHPDSIVQNHLLVIPATEIRNWLLTVLRDPTPTFLRDSERQMEKPSLLYTSGLSFEEKILDESCAGEKLEEIGGGDAAGTGGGESFGKKRIAIKVTIDPLNRTHDWPTLNIANWRNRIKDKLYLKTEVEIKNVLHRNSSGEIKLLCFSSIEEFFQGLAVPGSFPVTLLRGGIEAGEPPLVLAQLRNLGAKIVERAVAIEPKVSKTGVDFLHRIRRVIRILDSEEWFVLTPDDLQGLQDPNSAAWSEIFSENFDEGVTLLEELRTLNQNYGKVRI